MPNLHGQQPAFTPPNDDYDWDSDSQSNKGSSGVYILKASTDAVVRTPSWNKTETVIRPYPRPVDPRDPKSTFEPYKVCSDDNRTKFTNWMRKYACAWKVGNPTTTFLIRRPAGSSVFDPMTTPLGVLFRAVFNAVQRGQAQPDWAPMVIKQPGRNQQLTSPKNCYVMQGAIFRHNSKNYFGQHGEPLGFGSNPPCVLLCSGGAGDHLCEMLNKENAGYRGDMRDFEARFEHGDVTSPAGGKFIHFFEKGSSPYNRYQSQPVNEDNWGSAAGKGRGGENKFGFDIHIDSTFENIPAKLNETGQQVVRAKWREWNDILFFPDEAEQAHLLFRCMPLSACIYAFQGHNKDWIPEDAYKRAANAVSVQSNYQRTGPFTSQPQTYQPDPGFGDPKPTTTWPGDTAAATRNLDPTLPADNIDADAVVDATYGFDKEQDKNTAASIARLAAARTNMR